MSISLFWDVTQRRSVITDFSGISYPSLLQESSKTVREDLESLNPEDGTDRLSRNVGKIYSSTLCSVTEERRTQPSPLLWWVKKKSIFYKMIKIAASQTVVITSCHLEYTGLLMFLSQSVNINMIGDSLDRYIWTKLQISSLPPSSV